MTQYKTFKNKVEGLKDAIFENRSVKSVAQFTRHSKK